MKPWTHTLILFLLGCFVAACSAHREGVLPSDQNLPTASVTNPERVVPSPENRVLIVLLPDPDGKVGSLRVTTREGSQVLDQAGSAAQIDQAAERPVALAPLDPSEIPSVFGPALSAQPDLKDRFVSYILYFERDTINLVPESKERLAEVARSIRERKSKEIYVVGHTDRVGTEGYNLGLSSRRAFTIRDLLVSRGVQVSALVVSFHGEAMPRVPTEDEVAEPRNRRVEIFIR
jgi:outer membrane protein OmpA-like peptidoglycan-associated protein